MPHTFDFNRHLVSSVKMHGQACHKQCYGDIF